MKRKASLLANLEDKIPKLRKIIDESRRLFEAVEVGDVRGLGCLS